MSNLRVKSLVVGMVETNCYVIYNEETKEAVIVDPGDAPKQIGAKCREYGVKPVAIFLTHGHGYSVKTDSTFSRLLERAEKLGCDCAVFGHTHESLCDPRRKVMLVNPGSIKNGTYAVIEIENGVLKAAICTA